MNVLNFAAALETLAQTGEPKQAHLPEITAEKLLWVLDTCYNGAVEVCHPDMLSVIKQAEIEGKSAMHALGHWVDEKMDAAVQKGRDI